MRVGRTGARGNQGPPTLLCVVLFLLTITGLSTRAHAEEPGSEGGAPPIRIPGVPVTTNPSGGGGDGFEALLKLPDGYLAPNASRVAGAGEAEWRRRFERALGNLERAQRALEGTRRSLDEAAESGGASQWSVAPPGAGNSGGPSNSPLSFKLSQELARNREALDAAEKALRDLRIEADLAGVPAAWRGDAENPLPRRLPSTAP